MSRNQKTKLEVQTSIPLQVVPENSNVECAFTSADSYDLKNSLEKRKREAGKPIYLKRI